MDIENLDIGTEELGTPVMDARLYNINAIDELISIDTRLHVICPMSSYCNPFGECMKTGDKGCLKRASENNLYRDCIIKQMENDSNETDESDPEQAELDRKSTIAALSGIIDSYKKFEMENDIPIIMSGLKSAVTYLENMDKMRESIKQWYVMQGSNLEAHAFEGFMTMMDEYFGNTWN